jgi:hypothetical protein
MVISPETLIQGSPRDPVTFLNEDVLVPEYPRRPASHPGSEWRLHDRIRVITVPQPFGVELLHVSSPFRSRLAAQTKRVPENGGEQCVVSGPSRVVQGSASTAAGISPSGA